MTTRDKGSSASKADAPEKDQAKADDKAEKAQQKQAAADERAATKQERGGGPVAPEPEPAFDIDESTIGPARARLGGPEHPLADDMDPKAIERARRQGRPVEIFDEEQRVVNERTGYEDPTAPGGDDEARPAICFEVKNWKDGVIEDDRILHRDLNEKGDEGRIFVALSDDMAHDRQKDLERTRSALVGEAVVVQRSYITNYPHEV